MRPIEEIIIHCTGNTAKCKMTCEDIQDVARSYVGPDGGYHFIIDLNGVIHTMAGHSKVMWHAKGHNENSIGIAYIGGLGLDGKTPKNTLNEKQNKSLVELVTLVRGWYPDAKILGHNEISIKPCPCFDVQEWLKENHLV